MELNKETKKSETGKRIMTIKGGGGLTKKTEKTEEGYLS